MLESFLIYIGSLAVAAALTGIGAYVIAQGAVADNGHGLDWHD